MPAHCSTSCGFEQSKVSARLPACAEASLSVAGSGAQAALWLDTFAARKTHLATATILNKKRAYIFHQRSASLPCMPSGRNTDI